MASFVVQGSNRISGEISIHGAKNAALPILAGAILCPDCIIHNCPDLSDITAARNILSYLGCETHREGNSITVKRGGIINCDIPDPLMREMRSSIVFLGAIIARCGFAKISMPGGCELGPRPIDLHLSSLEKLGVQIEEDHGYLNCSAAGGLHGAVISLPFPSVGATENIILASCTAQGETVIYNAAREPEILDLIQFINEAGGKIRVDSDSTIIIQGVPALYSCEHFVIPDRIVAITYLCAAAVTKGDILVTNMRPEHIAAVLPALEETGCLLRQYDDAISLRLDRRPKPVKNIRTMPYPGFPTDAQAPLMALSTLAEGSSMYIENIFENRYKHAAEMVRMGAKIKVEGRVALVEGVKKLHGAPVECTDLRGGASLVLCALAAEGESRIEKINHIQRGYEDLEVNLSRLGANIKRSQDERNETEEENAQG